MKTKKFSKYQLIKWLIQFAVRQALCFKLNPELQAFEISKDICLMLVDQLAIKLILAEDDNASSGGTDASLITRVLSQTLEDYEHTHN